MGGDDLQLHSTYFVPRLELVGAAGGGLGSRTTHPEFATEGLAGVGGRFCLDFIHTTTDGGPPHYPFNGWGGGACYTALYNDDGYAQHRISAGIRPFLMDGKLMFPVDLTYIYQDRLGEAQHGGLLNVGVRWFFAGNMASGHVNPYFGGDIGIGGIGGHNFGGVFGELQAVFGVQFRAP